MLRRQRNVRRSHCRGRHGPRADEEADTDRAGISTLLEHYGDLQTVHAGHLQREDERGPERSVRSTHAVRRLLVTKYHNLLVYLVPRGILKNIVRLP